MRFTTFILKNVLRRPVRSILTGIGVALAVGAVVALLGISSGFEESFAEIFERRNVDLIVVRAGVAEWRNSIIDEQIGRRLQAAPWVERVTGGLMETVSFSEEEQVTTIVVVQGWEPDSFMFADLKFVEGRQFQPSDSRAVILGSVLAANLGKKVGDTVEIELEQFTVTGVYESFNVIENGSAIVPLSELQKLMDLSGKVTAFQVVVENTPGKKQVIQKLREYVENMKDERGRPGRLAAFPTRDYVERTLQIRMAHAMAWLTSAIALVIGAVGMLNTMIMSVFERTREIGILRAIGWRKSRIMWMILGESLVLCVVGAVAGTIGAVLLTKWLSSLPAVAGFIRGDIHPEVIAQGFAIALLVGLIGGLYPAYRGATLSPTEAIRHE